MLRWLEVETSALEADADASWHALLAPDVTRAQYARQLMSTLGFDGPLEAALALTPGLPEVTDLAARRTSGKIVEDLLALGFSASQIARAPQCGSIAPFDSAPRALGWLYAAERPLRLHGPVRKHLRACLPRVAGATAYLGSAADRCAAFDAAVDRTVRGPRDAAQVIDGACDAFRARRRWFAAPRAATDHVSSLR